jgi:RimJ/RimL family protein N-acetyltransferase
VNIRIRPVEDADLEVFFENQSDPVAREMAVFPERDRDAFDALWRRIRSNRDGVARTVEADGEVAGNVLSWLADGRRYLGYWIGREFWGRGVATAGVRLVLDEIDERPIFAMVADSNVGSKRVLENAGFVPTTDAPRAGPDSVMEWIYRLD